MSEEPPPRTPAPPVDAAVDATIRLEQTTGLVPQQRVLNRYVLEAVLGHGGMAVVWRARDETLGETIALKFLPDVVARDLVAVEELKEETRRARRLTHPNIVRIHDFVQDATMAAVSMEHVDGDTLAKLRLEQPGKIYSVAALTPLVVQLCGALDYAHTNAKMVHRDIKPANLLVTRDGQLKVADFGIARGLTEASSRLTGKAGRTSGTLVYGSPQQLMGEKPSESDDLYAVGATLYELLTGKPPFFRGDAHSLIIQVRDRAPITIAERRAELEVTGEAVPPAWEKTILSCLAKRVEERPKSAREVAEKLGLGSSLPHGATVTGKNAVTQNESGNAGTAPPRSKPLVLAGVAAAAIVMTLGWFLWPANPAAPEKVRPVVAAKSSDVVPPAAAMEFSVVLDPPEAEARVTVGPNSDVPVRNGKLVLTNLIDGEHELTVKAAGFRTFDTRVAVKGGRGAVDVKLIAVRGTLDLTARPGTLVTAIDSRGKETRGTIDATGRLLIENLSVAGRYKLRWEHADCETVERTEVEIGAEGPTKLAVEQVIAPGELRVFSVPAEAEVRINGKVVGKTPATLKNQPSETPLSVEVAAKGYRKSERSLTLRPREVRTVNVGTLVATTSGIEFRNLPAGFPIGNAQVLLDGREVKPKRDGGIWRLDELEPGARGVEVLHPDYEPWKQIVTVEDREFADVDVKPRPKPAKLSLVVEGAASFLLVANGREISIKGGVALLPAGEPVALELRAAGFKSVTRSLTGKPNGSENWDVKFEKQVLPQSGQSYENSLGMKFVPVPGSEVLFSIWDTRVQDYEKFVAATRREWPRPRFEQGPTHPAVNVSWNDAQAFCLWLTKKEHSEGRIGPDQKYRLPMDAEWSLAVGLNEPSGGTPKSKRSQIKGLYPWGKQWPPPLGAGNYAPELKADDFVNTSPVGTFKASRDGIYDLGGNAWQWCEDFYDGNSGPRALRGAGFSHHVAEYLLSSWRGFFPADSRNTNVGFRCMLAPTTAVQDGAERPANVTALTGAPTDIKPPPVRENSLGMKFVPVPGTRVLFSIWDTRVQDYEKFSSETGRKWPKPKFAQEQAHPAVNVSWDDAQAFCAWLTKKEQSEGRLGFSEMYRLPTDAEWSVAVGLNEQPGGTPQSKEGKIRGIYPWGTQWPPPKGAGNFADETKRQLSRSEGGIIDGYDDGFQYTSPVGSFAANKFGLCDMGGNVFQWCADFYDGGSGTRVLRGTSFGHRNATNLLSSSRRKESASTINEIFGFRCVMANTDNASGKIVEPTGAAGPGATTSSVELHPQRENSLGMKFVPVPGTRVLFSIWVTRVQDYLEFVNETQRTWDASSSFRVPSYPAVAMTWVDAKAFCAWLTDRERTAGSLSPGERYRLPTDAEWSVAVGLGRETGKTPKEKSGKIKGIYPWGTTWPPPAGAGNYADETAKEARLSRETLFIDNYTDGFALISPVGSFPPNHFGLFDMGGNAWQLCEDPFEGSLSGRRVVRGGSASVAAPAQMLSSYRGGWEQERGNTRYGFRCVLDVGESASK